MPTNVSSELQLRINEVNDLCTEAKHTELKVFLEQFNAEQLNDLLNQSGVIEQIFGKNLQRKQVLELADFLWNKLSCYGSAHFSSLPNRFPTCHSDFLHLIQIHLVLKKETVSAEKFLKILKLGKFSAKELLSSQCLHLFDRSNVPIEVYCALWDQLETEDRDKIGNDSSPKEEKPIVANSPLARERLSFLTATRGNQLNLSSCLTFS